MSKNIVICCDGTGNEYGDENSNVVKLYKTLIREPGKQVAYYHPGVGTMGAKNALSSVGKAWTKFRGLAFGYGVSDNIADAYQYLMGIYEPGDEIYVFGFSRGAYTARALCGMLRMFGLLSQGNEGMIPYALRLFKSSKKDKFKVAAGFQKTFCTDCKPYFLGVWDTVSSVGWILDPVGMKPWRLPYTADLPDLQVIRHAVSIDERRVFFRQNLVHQDPARDIKQVWFGGVHSDVGGSYPELESGLSKIAFQWMVRKAVKAGLQVNMEELARVLGAAPHYSRPHANAVMHNSMNGLWPLLEFFPKRTLVIVSPPGEKPPRFEPTLRINLFRRRFIPDGAVFHESVVERVRLLPKYRPSNMPNPIPQNQIEYDPPPEYPFVGSSPVRLEMGESLVLEIESKAKWNVTPLRVQAREVYRFEASGTWHDASIPSGPKGYQSPNIGFRLVAWLRRVPKANWFALVCMIDRDTSTRFDFTHGEQSDHGHLTVEATMSKDGFLNCFANDLPFTYWNNSGSVQLKITRIPSKTPLLKTLDTVISEGVP